MWYRKWEQEVGTEREAHAMSTEEKGSSCEINQKTVADTMRKLGFDKVLQQEDVLGYGGMPMWPDTSECIPYEGVPLRKPGWRFDRYPMRRIPA